jgi:hypothetical protein
VLRSAEDYHFKQNYMCSWRNTLDFYAVESKPDVTGSPRRADPVSAAGGAADGGSGSLGRFSGDPAMNQPCTCNDQPCYMTLRIDPVTTVARERNRTLWHLLTKPEPLTAEEWAYVAQLEAMEP